MKIENQQSNITNPQFSGGRQIGPTVGAQSSTYANASILFTGITTGSTSQAKGAATFTTTANGFTFSLTGSDGSNAVSGTFFVTSSGQADAPPFYYIATGSTVPLVVANIATEINALSSTFGIIALASASVLQLTASVYGADGNSYSLTSGSATTTLAGGLTLGTGSFTLTDTFGITNRFNITSSNQATASLSATTSVNGSTFYIAGGATQAATISNIAAFLNVSASAIVTASSSSTNLNLTSSLNGDAGNYVNVVSGSTTTYLSGGAGNTTYAYSFPFIAGGLYVGGAGAVEAITLDGSRLTFASASAGSVIPGLFLSVSGSSTATGVIALK